MAEQREPVVIKQILTLDEVIFASIQNRPGMRAISLDDIIVQERERKVVEDKAKCPVCENPDLVIFIQAIFEGPVGKEVIGGPQLPEYMRSEIRKECDHCGIRSWRLTPEQREKFGF